MAPRSVNELTMVAQTDVAAVVAAARALNLQPRGQRWTHLSLCVLDAVFSIGGTYTATARACRAYATWAGLPNPLAPADDVAAGRHTNDEQPLSALVRHIEDLGPDVFARDVVRHEQPTSSSGTRAILKADAALRYARVLTGHGVQRLTDVTDVLTDDQRLRAVEQDLYPVPGHGTGIRVAYLWMTAGDDHHVKADRMVLRWLTRVVGRGDDPVNVTTAGQLLTAAAAELGVTPWMLDHAVWRHESGR